MSTAAQIPHDIKLEILSRLPVKSIYRFKCVSKQWLSFFSDRKFISLHRKKTSTNSKTYSLLVDQDYTTTLFNFHYMEKPIKVFRSKGYYLVGICNGIACFTYSNFGMGMVLYNPAIKLNKLMDFKLGRNLNTFPWPRTVIGFGLGLNEDEFIIIRIFIYNGVIHQPQEEQAEVHVYATVANSWRKIELEFKYRIKGNCVIVHKGIPYWVGLLEGSEEDKDESVTVLIWYDLEIQVFKHLRIPKLDSNKKLSTRFVELKDNLALLVCKVGDNDNFSKNSSCVDVWILDHDGQCFGKGHRIGPIKVAVGRLIGCLPSGEILFMKKRSFDLFLFDPVTQKDRYIYSYEGENPYAEFSVLDVLNYTESLITIDGMKQYEV